MFKTVKVKPQLSHRVSLIKQFPHCDQRILHAPYECTFCDAHPEWQALRQAWNIAFTGYTPEDTELPCPADHARGDAHTKWGGNAAIVRTSGPVVSTAVGAMLSNSRSAERNPDK